MTRGPAYAGPLLIFDHLFDALLALLAVALSAAAGHRFLRFASLAPAATSELVLYAVAVGAGLWSVLFLGLGAAGLLSGGWIAGAVAAGGLALRRDLRRLGALVGDAASEVRAAAAGRWLGGIAAAAAAGAGLFLFLHGSAPPGDWDSLMYHLEVPERWLAEGRIHLVDGNLHVAYTGLVQLLYLPFLAVGSPAAAALLNGAFALLLALAVFVLGERLLDAETGTLASAALWASTGLLMVAITARLDTTLAFYLLLGHGALVAAALEPSSARRRLLLAALVLGLSVGIKYHAVAYGACLVPVALWAVWRGAGSRARRLRWVAGAAGVAAVAALPWMAKNQILLGGPFYPFFTEPVLPPWLARLYGSTAIPESVDARALGALGQAREPFDLLTLFLAPERLTVEPEAAHYHPNALFLLLPLGLLHPRRGRVAALALPPLLYVAGIAFFRPTTNLRYLFPALAPLTLVAALVAVWLAGKIFRRPLVRRGVLGAAALLILVPTVRSAVAWTRRAPVVEQALGTVSRQVYLAAGFGFYAGLAGSVNRNVPPDGRVLLLWEARGFYLAPPHLPDNVLRNWPLLAPYLERSGSCLEQAEITHVLVSDGAVSYYVSRGADPSIFGRQRLERFLGRCAEVVDAGPGYTLHRLRAGG